jgi:hypothetical protein
MTLIWKLNRIRRMDGREVAYRVGQALQAAIEQVGLCRAQPSKPSDGGCGVWQWPLPGRFDRDAYAAAGDAILSGRYRIFQMTDARIGFPPAWNRDPKTGTVAPLKFGKTLNYRDERLVGNIKYLWEINRHLELVTLAQAWHLAEDPRFSAGCRVALESWLEQCPYPMGPNWTSSLELAIRVVNWSFAWHLLGGHSAPLFRDTDGKRFKARWLASIYQHCHFIAGHLSRYSSANNHLLGELMGLLVGATTWPLWQESGTWRGKARHAFEQEALRQTAEDGVNREQGIWYHHEVVDMMLIAGLVGRANGIEFSDMYWSRLEQMLSFIASVMDVAGNVPAWGDSDDAVIVRFCPADNCHVYRSQLCTGAILFDRGDFKAKAGRFDDKSRWMLGDDAEVRFAAMAADVTRLPARRAFADGGYYILGSEFETPREVRIVADAGPLGYLSIAAHGHADALSLTLSVAGREILIDPGTYAYHTDRKWRDYFRGTAAHNTLRVDGQDQSVAGGSFLWTHHARAACEEFQPLGECQRLRMSHDGYGRLRDPVQHERDVTFEPAAGRVWIDDRIKCLGEHLIEIHWHFSEHCHVQLDRDYVRIECRGVAVILRWPAGCAASLARGEETPPLGWISRRFDAKQPSFSLAVSRQIIGSWQGRSSLEIIEPARAATSSRSRE